ncbi:MAG: type VI secretion system tip protein TssI/VgrG [Sandaracinus sp.]
MSDEGERGGASQGLPAGMSIPVLPQASQPAAGVESALQGVARVADTAGAAVQLVEGVTGASANGGGVEGAAVVTGVASGLGSALGGAATFTSGMDPGVSQALGVASAGLSALGGASHLLTSILGLVADQNQHRVRFALSSSALEGAAIHVASFTCEERIGRPFVLSVVLAADDLDLDPTPMLGASARLTLERGEGRRRVIGGIVSRVEIGRTTDRARIFTVEIVPAMALLALRKDSRVFQGLTALDVIDRVVGGALEGYDRTVELRARGTYATREHCLQYDETDLDFVHRLMEEEGLTYLFEWDEEGVERVVVVDHVEDWPRLLPGDAKVPFVPQRNETSDTEHVHELLARAQLRTTAFALRDLDWTQAASATCLEARAEGDGAPSRERYDHARAVTLGPYRGTAYGRSDVEARGRVIREAHAAERRVVRGAANLIGLAAGRVMEVERHPIVALDEELAVIAVSHRGHAPELRDLFGNEHYATEDQSYECTFEALSASAPYRMPIVTPKPRVHGLLSAIVVGASGQEIHSDEHRRVRIQMRWDREGTLDERSSCFVRVLQAWGGPGFGALFLPRVGMEVAVAFEGGDPDRPMVVGCLYDGDNPAPYTSESDWTKSTLRTKSSPDPGDGVDHFNELRFEDAAGREQVYLRAERDLDEDVQHDHSTHVHRNQTQRVDGDQSESIGRDASLHVRRHRHHTVDHSEWVTIHENRETAIDGSDTCVVKGEHRCEVGSDTHYVHHGKRTVHVRGDDSEAYHGSVDVWVQSHERRTVQGASETFVHGASDLQVDVHHRVKKGATELVVADGIFAGATGNITLLVGDNRIAIAPDGAITIHGARVTMANAGSTASIALTASGEVQISGSGGVSLSCGQSSVSLSPSGVSTSGTQISASAIADHTITGAIVRIN